jgi:hypothetical protein
MREQPELPTDAELVARMRANDDMAYADQVRQTVRIVGRLRCPYPTG